MLELLCRVPPTSVRACFALPVIVLGEGRNPQQQECEPECVFRGSGVKLVDMRLLKWQLILDVPREGLRRRYVCLLVRYRSFSIFMYSDVGVLLGELPLSRTRERKEFPE